MIKKIKKNLSEIKELKTRYLLLLLTKGPWGKLLSDRCFLKIKFYAVIGRKLNLNNPKSYNEKLQWLKLYDRKKIYTTMVDKFEAKKLVASIIGEEYIVPTLGVYDSFNQIDFDKLPNKFLLKCTHDSGGVVVCDDKASFDFKDAEKIISDSLNRNFYYEGREWPYKNVKPRIIAEKYIDEDDVNGLKDYKFFCFDGVAKAMFISSDRISSKKTKFDFFDMDFNHLPFNNGHPNSKENIIKPNGFEKMKSLSEKLSIGIPQVRIDFYDVKGHIYFSEITFFSRSGLVRYDPKKWDYIFGSWINIKNKRSVDN